MISCVFSMVSLQKGSNRRLYITKTQQSKIKYKQHTSMLLYLSKVECFSSKCVLKLRLYNKFKAPLAALFLASFAVKP